MVTDQPMLTVTVAVGWTSSRPLRPDEHIARVVVAVADRDDLDTAETEAQLMAAQMVAATHCPAGRVPQMPTSTRIVAMVL